MWPAFIEDTDRGRLSWMWHREINIQAALGTPVKVILLKDDFSEEVWVKLHSKGLVGINWAEDSGKEWGRPNGAGSWGT